MIRSGVVAVAVWALLAPALASARVWISASGAVQIEAELIEKRADGTVVLKRADGVTIETRPEKFSAADQAYIKQWGAAAQETPAAETPEEAAPKKSATPQEPSSALPPDAVAAATKIKSADAQAAIKAFEDKDKELAAAHSEKQKQYREKLAAMLEDCLKEASAAGNLDDALAIRNAIKQLKSGQPQAAPQAGKPVAEPKDAAPSEKQDDKELAADIHADFAGAMGKEAFYSLKASKRVKITDTKISFIAVGDRQQDSAGIISGSVDGGATWIPMGEWTTKSLLARRKSGNIHHFGFANARPIETDELQVRFTYKRGEDGLQIGGVKWMLR